MKIKCAAVKKDGVIYEGNSHWEIGQKYPGVLKNSDQGFVTECGKFANRKAALLIAERAGQIGEKHGPPNMLFSEDLKPRKPNKSEG